MFRRRWSGLPDDPEFPADLKGLGYFVNEDDEIRSTKDPKFYFDYFMNKSVRHNDRQRFAFDLAVQDLIHTRLVSPPLNLTKLSLPLDTPTTSPHTPIFISSDLHLKKRIVVLFGEPDQDLGVFAHRVVGGARGVDAGSAVGLLKTVLAQSGDDDVGFVLANTGERWWWPEGQRALSYRQSGGVRMKSAVHRGRYFDLEVNGIPGNATVDEHVRTVFDNVLGNAEFVGKEARIEIIGVSEGGVSVEKFFDENWTAWKDRIVSLALLGTGLDQTLIKDSGFRTFLIERTRAYITCTEPLSTPMANPGGNPFAHYNTTFGCPVLSSGEDYHSELTLIKAQPAVLAWMGEVRAADRDGRAYTNPVLEVTFHSEEFEETRELRDCPPFEGFPKPVGPPPNVSAFVDDDESGEVKAIQHADTEPVATELQVEPEKGEKTEQGVTAPSAAESEVAEDVSQSLPSSHDMPVRTDEAEPESMTAQVSVNHMACKNLPKSIGPLSVSTSVDTAQPETIADIEKGETEARPLNSDVFEGLSKRLPSFYMASMDDAALLKLKMVTEAKLTQISRELELRRATSEDLDQTIEAPEQTIGTLHKTLRAVLRRHTDMARDLRTAVLTLNLAKAKTPDDRNENNTKITAMQAQIFEVRAALKDSVAALKEALGRQHEVELDIVEAARDEQDGDLEAAAYQLKFLAFDLDYLYFQLLLEDAAVAPFAAGMLARKGHRDKLEAIRNQIQDTDQEQEALSPASNDLGGATSMVDDDASESSWADDKYEEEAELQDQKTESNGDKAAESVDKGVRKDHRDIVIEKFTGVLLLLLTLVAWLTYLLMGKDGKGCHCPE